MVRRLLRSEPFARSRRRAELIDGDREAIEELVELVRLRHVEEDARLAPLAEVVEESLRWLVESGAVADRTSSVPARRRVVIAALCYLYDADDVIPDDRRDGTVDDYAVLESVLTRAMLRGAR